jgi:ribonuclease P protein component
VAVRVGFTTSKKVGNAVARNRARRRLRAAVDEVFPALARPGLDYVVIGRQETVARPYSLLLQDLRTALKRVGGLRSDADQSARESKAP